MTPPLFGIGGPGIAGALLGIVAVPPVGRGHRFAKLVGNAIATVILGSLVAGLIPVVRLAGGLGGLGLTCCVATGVAGSMWHWGTVRLLPPVARRGLVAALLAACVAIGFGYFGAIR